MEFRRKRFRIYKKNPEGRTFDEYEAFIRDINVPDDIRVDEDTERAKRGDVKQRRIAVAFPIDGEKLFPIEGARTVPTVCSFIPLTEEVSGLKFLIHGDFLAHPGRARMKHEAKWNEWLVHEVGKLAKDATREYPQKVIWSGGRGETLVRLFYLRSGRISLLILSWTSAPSDHQRKLFGILLNTS